MEKVKKAIWGDSSAKDNQTNQSGEEPVSGKSGDTSKGEPYDAGNSGSKSYLLSM